MQIVGARSELTAQGVVEVVVPDLPAALSFYDRLGFTIERETPTFVTLRWHGVLLFIAENPNATTGPRWANLRIIVPDVDEVWNRVNAQQIPVGNPIGDRPYGLRDFTVKAPCGFEIRFAQVL